MSLRISLAACLLMLAAPQLCRADVRLPGLFAEHMVMQRDRPMVIWGWAAAGEKVSVSLGVQTGSAVADADGKWKVILAPLPAGGPLELKIAGNNTIVVKDVLIGEVWLCSGQQNMEFWLRDTRDAASEIVAAKYPQIRWFTVQRQGQDAPAENVIGSWNVCSPEKANTMPAVGYFFARELQNAIGVPVGLINASWSGSYAEAWTTPESLLADPDLKPILDRTNQQRILWAKEMVEVKAETERWFAEVAKAKAAGLPFPLLPSLDRQIRNPLESWEAASCMYQGMIAPLALYPIRGVVWYQGESNVGRAWQYRKLLPTMIGDWRRNWSAGGSAAPSQQDLPFLIVQLPNCRSTAEQPGESEWAELREAQLQALAVPRTGLAVTIDIGEAERAEPANKQDVGRRLALVARGTVYSENIVYSGPIYDSMTIDGDKIVLRFKHVGGGLVAKGGPLKQFAIAGADKRFVWADAKIIGDTVVISSSTIKEPVAVRYAWANNPAGCNLYNADGLPPSPFRTDDWPGLTDKQR